MSEQQQPTVEKKSYRDLLRLRQNGFPIDEFEFFFWRREEELLRSAMHFPNHYRDSGIIVAHFTAPYHALAWEAFSVLCEEQPGMDHIDSPMLSSKMQTLNSSFAGPAASAWFYAMNAEDPIHPEVGMSALVKDVVHYYRLRQWRKTHGELAARIGSDVQIDKLQATIASISQDFVYEVQGEGRVALPLGQMEWDPRDTTKVRVVKTGIEHIDRAGGGGHGFGELMVVGGGTGHGKSYLAQRLLRRGAQLGNSVLYISCEDPLELLRCRMYADFCDPPQAPDEIRNRTADPEIIDQAVLKMREEFGDKITAVHMPKPTVSQVCHAIRYYRYTRNVVLVIVDYLQAVTEDQPATNRTAEVSSVISKLKKCFSETDVAGVVMTQYARDEYREGEEPSINAAKYAGDIENESELMAFLWKDKEDTLHVKIPKAKWKKAKELRFKIQVSPITGCHGDWQEDFG